MPSRCAGPPLAALCAGIGFSELHPAEITHAHARLFLGAEPASLPAVVWSDRDRPGRGVCIRFRHFRNSKFGVLDARLSRRHPLPAKGSAAPVSPSCAERAPDV
jgi:hypothetical protein